MSIDHAIRRAQVYGFLSATFLYPADNWTEDVPLLNAILGNLDGFPAELPMSEWAAEALRSEHLRIFGAVGSPCYEMEWGMPNEFRMAQELADIAGFYRAFGFTVGGVVRERPDHVAVELEFMAVLALKEAAAAERGIAEHVEVCVDAQRKFLADHLGRWVGLLSEGLDRLAPESVYAVLARFADACVQADAARLGISLEPLRLAEVKATPPGPDLSACGDCPLAGE